MDSAVTRAFWAGDGPYEDDRWDIRREAALLAAGLGVSEYDSDTRTLYMDAAAADHHGVVVPPHGQLSADAWLTLFTPEDQQDLLQALDGGIPAGVNLRLAVRLQSVDPKDERVLELIFRQTSTPGRYTCVSRDVTTERSREEMRRQKLAAERANQAKSDFMSQVSHELRTPLNAILGFAQLMAMDQDTPLPTTHRDRLDVLQHSARRLLGLIDQLLQIGRIEQGKRTLKPKSVEVRVVAKRCIDALHLMALERRIDVSLEIDESQQATVRADPEALEQVLTNLLSNAIKYNRERGRVRIRFVAEGEGRITIDDTGKGFTDSQLGRLFEPFNRLAAARTQVPGTGLGLVITKQLVQAMGGKLEVASEAGKGSRFTVSLPLGRRVRNAVSETMPLDLPSQWDTGMRYSVLYIEDDEINQVLMDQVFSTQPDWDLHTASNGAEGISLARRQQPQLVLLDMNLPDMTGAEVFKHLKADPRTRHIPCVAVSADALPDQIARAQEAGFEDYWTKPLDLLLTVGRLKSLLR